MNTHAMITRSKARAAAANNMYDISSADVAAHFYNVRESLYFIAKLNGYDGCDSNCVIAEFIVGFESDYVDAIVEYLIEMRLTKKQIVQDMKNEATEGWTMYDDFISENN